MQSNLIQEEQSQVIQEEQSQVIQEVQSKVIQEEQSLEIQEKQSQMNQEKIIKQPVLRSDHANKNKYAENLFHGSHGLEDFILLDKIGSVS